MERALLEYLLDGDWDGADVARQQLVSARYAGAWFDGSQSFDIDVAPDVTLLAEPDGILDATDRMVFEGETQTGGVMIWARDGRLDSLEYYWVTAEMPTRLPNLSQTELRPRTQWPGHHGTAPQR
jgi:hypothetical protein